MKYQLISLLFPIVFLACSESKSSNDLIEKGEMMNIAANDTCACNDLVDSLSVFYRDDKPFTGVCIHNYPGSESKYMAKGMMNGKLHGKLTYYDQMGNVILEETYDNGNIKRNGNIAPISCDCTELMIKPIPGEGINRAFLDEIPFTGTCSENYAESSQKYMDLTYKNGVLEGFSTYYDKSGNAMFLEKYERGELVKIIHDKN